MPTEEKTQTSTNQHTGKKESIDSSNDKKAFGHDVGKLVSGTVIAQAVSICLTPVITRIFNPEIYGVFTVFLSIVSIISVIVCMRYELAILLPKDDNDAGAVLLLCILIICGICILCIPILLLFGDSITDLLGNEGLKSYLFFIPVAVFVDGLYLAFRYWNTRRKRFGAQAVTQALQSISKSGLQLGAGVAGFVLPGSLIAGQIIGSGVGVFILFIQIVKHDINTIKCSLSLSKIKKQLIKYKKFPIFDTWASFFNTISWSLPALLLTGFFSSAVAGLYALGQQILHIPMNFIGSSISQVFYQRISVEKYTGKLASIVEEVTAVLIILSVLPILVLGIIGGQLFGFVFGEEWFEAGVFVQILCVWTIVWFVSSPLTMLFPALEMQKEFLIFTICNIVTRAISLTIGGICGNVYLCLILFAASGVLTYGIMSIYVLIKSKASIKNILSSTKKEVIISLLISFLLLIISIILGKNIAVCVIGIIFVLIYIMYIYRRNVLVKTYFGK